MENDRLFGVHQNLQEMATGQLTFLQIATCALPSRSSIDHREEMTILIDKKAILLPFNQLKVDYMSELGDKARKDAFCQADTHSLQLIHPKNLLVLESIKLKLFTAA
jgi:hypothetical protein